MQAKIRELYKASQQQQEQQNMMNHNNYASSGHMANAYQMMGLAGVQNAAALAAYNSAAAQSTMQGRNPYTTGSASGYYAAAASNSHYPPVAAAVQPAARTIPVHPPTSIVSLPVYDIKAELLKPASLIPQGNNRFQEASFQFFLSASQASDVASNRDISVGPQPEYLYQIQLRFCQLSLEAGKEVSDEFPPSVCVNVNGKMAALPNPIPTNKPGVEPKRPPRPVNITSMCKLSPIAPNNINVKWAAEYGKG